MTIRVMDLFREEEDSNPPEHRVKVCNIFERIVNNLLMLLIGIVVVMGLVDLVYEIITDINATSILEEIEKMPEILSLFLWILIALELLDSVRTYARDHYFHVETVVSVAVVAVARKVIILDLHSSESLTVLSLAAVIMAVCGGYFLVRRSHLHEAENSSQHHQAN